MVVINFFTNYWDAYLLLSVYIALGGLLYEEANQDGGWWMLLAFIAYIIAWPTRLGMWWWHVTEYSDKDKDHD